jgi:DNA-binding transcriptional LysR family regulator
MLYTVDGTTGVLLRDVARGRLDLAVTFCAPNPPAGVELLLLHQEPAIVHLPSDHRLASRPQLRVEDLEQETILVGATEDSRGFSDRVLAAFRITGITPRALADPYPDLGLQAVREGLGIVIYPRSAFPAQLAGSAFIPLAPPLEMPFHLAYRAPAHTPALRSVLQVARALHTPPAADPSTLC